MAIELPEGIRTSMLCYLHLKASLKIEWRGNNIVGWQIIFHLINQSYEKKITFVKRQAIAALITLNEKTNENFKMEVNYAPAEGIKKEKKRMV